ncbi:myocyte-specific enhancer factor 2B-like [Teratosphaeria destructans]|uniref:Myocyte-specific enhancer factor 2B-like n=1 Tax=Teratosphaeria destructans TaxID=418781 RepID=A0A9W7W5L8_9PEZI|nr:myocyte-specific enhancer factor 2B-like [Teratosphaeria destructans]
MGRRKIEIKPIRDDRNRSVTFLKRKGGLFKKAHELSVLCSVDVAVVIFGHNKKLYEYSSSDINEIIGRFQYYGGAHEHKGPADFADKGQGDDDDDEDGAEDGGEERGTPAPGGEQAAAAIMQQQHAQMANHPGFQNVRHGTPNASPPMHNGAVPQFVRGPSPLPPGDELEFGTAASTADTGSVPAAELCLHAQPSFLPAASGADARQTTRLNLPSSISTGAGASVQQIQQAYMGGDRRQSMPPAFPQPPAHANMARNPATEHLQPPQARPHPSPHASPQLQQATGGPTPSPQPPQQPFSSPRMPQPKPLPAHAKQHIIFTPIDDSRSMLSQHWGATSNAEGLRSDPAIKLEDGAPRSQSIDVAAMQRQREVRLNGSSPGPGPRHMPSPQPPNRAANTASVPPPAPPTRQNTNQSDAKRPRLKVQIPSEQSGDEGGTASAPDESSTGQLTTGPQQQQQQQQGPPHGVVLPPPSPSAGTLLSAGAQGPPNPFARPAPPMSTNPHAMNREHIETPISALPSRFMSDNLLPSPSTFYPEWGFGRSGDSNMLPSPLNFQTPVVSNGQGWREEDRKRQNEDDGYHGGGDAKRPKT